MNILALDVWEPHDVRNKFIDRVKREKPDKVILFGQNEFDYYNDISFPNLLEILSSVESRGQQLHLTIGAYPSELEPNLPNLNVYYWVDWFFKKSFNTCIYISKDYSGLEYADFSYYKQSLEKQRFQHYLTSLNYRSHKHRCLMIDLLAKNNLIEGNAISWHHMIKNGYGHAETYDWKYFKPGPLRLSNNFDDGWMRLPNEYFNSFAQLISESTPTVSFFTEKTVMAIICHKPFLICSVPNLHKKLKDMGFELYDEIFDYSFDSVEDEELRYQMVLDNFSRIQRENTLSDLSTLHEKIKPKLIYNFEKLKKIVYNFDTIPDVAMEVYDDFKRTGIDHCPLLTGFMDSLEMHKKIFT